MRGPKSIRLRATLALSLVVALLWLGAAALTARGLSAEMDEVFDSALQETGQRILQLAVIDILEREEEGLTKHVNALASHDEYYTYLVRDAQGQVLLTSHQADPRQFPLFKDVGFQENQGMRFYQEAAVRGTIILTIAEPLAHRREVARDLALGLGLPLLVIIPLSLLGIASALGFGLRPLGQLHAQLSKRDANDLTPLSRTKLPAELQPIGGAINQLFVRLRTAFDAERNFASNAAHELRTPLAGALAQVQRLRQDTKDPETIKRAEVIEAALKRLTRLSERLMQLARAEGAELILAKPYDIRQVLQLVVDDFVRSPLDADLLFVIPEVAVLGAIDPDALAIVARNLIENALRHGARAPISVTAHEDGWLLVTNDCEALEQATLKDLSKRFMRGQGAGIGAGLGLAIVHTIATRTGAEFQLTSPLAGQDRGFCAAINLAPPKANKA